MTVRFRDGQLRAGGLRLVLGEPAVALEAEGLGGGAFADVELSGNLRAAEGDGVVRHPDLAAGREAGFAGFLQDAEDPLGGPQDGIAGELRAIDAGESAGTGAAFEGVVADDNVLGLVRGTGWTEVVEAGGTADLDRTLAGILEHAVLDHDPARSALELRSGVLGEPLFASDPTSADEGVRAADEVDGLASPAGDFATLDAQLLKAGTLDRIEVPLRSDVLDPQVFQHRALHRRGALTAVVEVEAVAGLALAVKVAQGQSRAARKLPGIGPAAEQGWRLRIERFDGEIRKPAERVAARILARPDLERVAGFQRSERGLQFRLGFDHQGLGREWDDQ